jgi:hypothetical protein
MLTPHLTPASAQPCDCFVGRAALGDRRCLEDAADTPLWVLLERPRPHLGTLDEPPAYCPSGPGLAGRRGFDVKSRRPTVGLEYRVREARSSTLGATPGRPVVAAISGAGACVYARSSDHTSRSVGAGGETRRRTVRSKEAH